MQNNVAKLLYNLCDYAVGYHLLRDHDKISEIEGVRTIGHITKKELGCMLATRDDNEFELTAQGWNPLSKKE